MSVAATAPHAGLLEEPNQTFGATNGKVGMWLFLGSDAMSFVGFLCAYMYLRLRSDNWMPVEHWKPNLVLIGINTFILICSSVTMVKALASVQDGNQAGLKKFLGLTILGGLTFLGIQVFEYNHLISEAGLSLQSLIDGKPGMTNYGATFFFITGFHGCHVLGGVIYLSVILLRAIKGAFSPTHYSPVEIVGLYWHFVDLVWIMVFTVIYLL